MDCCVPGCISKRKVQMHKFPKNLEIGETWLKRICSPKLAKFSYEDIRRKQYRVCHLHFTADSWIPTLEKPRLRDDALPTLLLPQDPVLRCVVPTDQAQEDRDPQKVTMNLVMDLSPPKYEKSPSASPIRKSSLNTPPLYSKMKGTSTSQDLNIVNKTNENVSPSVVDATRNASFKRKLICSSSSSILKVTKGTYAQEKKLQSVGDNIAEKNICEKGVEVEENFESSAEVQPEIVKPRIEEKNDVIRVAPHVEGNNTRSFEFILEAAKDKREVTSRIPQCKNTTIRDKEVKENQHTKTVIQRRKRRILLSRKNQTVDLTFKARKVYDEALRLRKKFHKVKDRLRRYVIENECIKRENNLLQSH